MRANFLTKNLRNRPFFDSPLPLFDTNNFNNLAQLNNAANLNVGHVDATGNLLQVNNHLGLSGNLYNQTLQNQLNNSTLNYQNLLSANLNSQLNGTITGNAVTTAAQNLATGMNLGTSNNNAVNVLGGNEAAMNLATSANSGNVGQINGSELNPELAANNAANNLAQANFQNLTSAANNLVANNENNEATHNEAYNAAI